MPSHQCLESTRFLSRRVHIRLSRPIHPPIPHSSPSLRTLPLLLWLGQNNSSYPNRRRFRLLQMPLCSLRQPKYLCGPSFHSLISVLILSFKSRAVIKVVDEEIAAIEASNRELLSRAIAAEAVANSLREQNSLLQLKAEHCDQHHRPKTAPSRPSPTREPRYKSTSTTSLSNFNTTFDRISVPKRKPNKASSHASALSQP